MGSLQVMASRTDPGGVDNERNWIDLLHPSGGIYGHWTNTGLVEGRKPLLPPVHQASGARDVALTHNWSQFTEIMQQEKARR